MIKKGMLLLVVVALLGLSETSNADLVEIGYCNYGFLIYEDNSINGGLVWLDYSNHPGPWKSQVDWVNNLWLSVYDIVIYPQYTTNIDWSEWRLPSAGSVPAGGYSEYHDGFGHVSSEMGHLYYVSLMKQSGPLGDTSPFRELLAEPYWSNTEDSGDIATAWNFTFSNGHQNTYDKSNNYFYGLAVHSGEVSVVTVP